jgi:hypothetical protein
MDSARTPIWCVEEVEEVSSAAALRKLDQWSPDIAFGQAALSAELEEQICGIAPLVSMVHDYRGSCISGSKTYSWPSVKACSRRFGPGCLAYFYSRRCGGLNPLTMLADYRVQSQRLADLRRSAINNHRIEPYA